MNGNPHAEDVALSMHSARNAGIPHDNEAPYLLQEAQIEATLALAYEQRTANLLHALEISYRAQGSGLRVDSTDIMTRLGLNEGATK